MADLTSEDIKQLFIDIERSGHSRRIVTVTALLTVDAENCPPEKRDAFRGKVDLLKRNSVTWCMNELKKCGIAPSRHTQVEHDHHMAKGLPDQSLADPMDVDRTHTTAVSCRNSFCM